LIRLNAEHRCREKLVLCMGAYLASAAHMDFDQNIDPNVLLRLIVALILSAVLGWERKKSGKAAGIRTHMLVGISATLFVVAGELFVLRFQALNQNMSFDPLRIIQAVVTGISFLGAGTIFVSRGNERVKGLTTAATIWVTSAVGMMVGLEHYLLAACSTAIVFCILQLPDLIMSRKDDRD
jgi:putative Mg2+ transporter-C (MgtC) family protein